MQQEEKLKHLPAGRYSSFNSGGSCPVVSHAQESPGLVKATANKALHLTAIPAALHSGR